MAESADAPPQFERHYDWRVAVATDKCPTVSHQPFLPMSCSSNSFNMSDPSSYSTTQDTDRQPSSNLCPAHSTVQFSNDQCFNQSSGSLHLQSSSQPSIFHATNNYPNGAQQTANQPHERLSCSPEQPSDDSKDSNMSTHKRLHISNIPFKYREFDIRELFHGYGEIIDVEIIFNDRGSKGFGFITLADASGAIRAKQELNGKVVDGRKIEINEATERKGPPKSKSSSHGSWLTNSYTNQTSSTWYKNSPYGGNYKYAGYQYSSGGRGGYRGGEMDSSLQGRYGYQHQPSYHQDYSHGGYNYQDYGGPPQSHQSQWSHPSNQSYYSGGHNGVAKAHDYRFSPY